MTRDSRPAPLGQGFTLCRDFALRSTGFSVDILASLSDPECGPALDVLAGEAEDTADRARGQAMDGVRQAGRRVKQPEQVRKLRRASDLLYRQRPIPAEMRREILAMAPELEKILEALDRAEIALARGREQAQAYYRASCVRIGRAIRDIAREPRFREAVIWQNRQLIARCLDPLLATPPEQDTSRARAKERLVARYIQRYCTKNDFIGFFGPIAWGVFSDRDEAIECRPGPDLISGGEVFFEYWAIDALARKQASVPAIREELRPRRMPYVHIAGDRAMTPMGEVDLPLAAVAILARCDGTRTARQLASELVEAGNTARSAEQVYGVLDQLADHELIWWGFEIPKVRDGFDQVLRRQLVAITDSAARREALEELDELVAARDTLARARGDGDAVAEAMGSLERTFERLTGTASTRRAGETYAARTLIYLDCRRDVTLELGAPLQARMAPPLRLLMHSARWLSVQVAACYEDELVDLHRSLHSRSEGPGVALGQFWSLAASLFPRAGAGQRPPAVAAVFAEYQRRWDEILAIKEGSSRVEHSAVSLAGKVAEYFAATTTGWPSARVSSPDVHIAAPSVEAIAAGHYSLVLGELHFHCNTLELYATLRHHPDPEAVIEAMHDQYPHGRIAHTTPSSDAARSFLTPLTSHPGDRTVEYEAIPSWRPRDQTIGIGELVVVEEDGHLMVQSRDGGQRWNLIAVMDALLTEYNPAIISPRPHTPRVTIDHVVIAREAWRFAVADLPFRKPGTSWQQFRVVRRWAQDLGMPRRCFYRVSAEVKPSYLDLDSPLLVDCFVRSLGRSESLTISEMLPTPEQCWLADAQGRRYTAELRLAAVDPEPWQPHHSEVPGRE